MTISRLARLLNRVIGGRSSSAGQTQNTLTVFSSEEEGIDKQLQFSSKWYLHARKIPYALHPASLKLPSVAFQTVPVSIRLDYRFFSSFQKKNVERFLFPHPSPPGDPRCAVLGFVPASSVSSSSTLKIFRDASHLRCLLFLPGHLLGHFHSLRHVHGSTSTCFFECAEAEH